MEWPPRPLEKKPDESHNTLALIETSKLVSDQSTEPIDHRCPDRAISCSLLNRESAQIKTPDTGQHQVFRHAPDYNKNLISITPSEFPLISPAICRHLFGFSVSWWCAINYANVRSFCDADLIPLRKLASSEEREHSLVCGYRVISVQIKLNCHNAGIQINSRHKEWRLKKRNAFQAHARRMARIKPRMTFTSWASVSWRSILFWIIITIYLRWACTLFLNVSAVAWWKKERQFSVCSE